MAIAGSIVAVVIWIWGLTNQVAPTIDKSANQVVDTESSGSRFRWTVPLQLELTESTDLLGPNLPTLEKSRTLVLSHKWQGTVIPRYKVLAFAQHSKGRTEIRLNRDDGRVTEMLDDDDLQLSDSETHIEWRLHPEEQRRDIELSYWFN